MVCRLLTFQRRCAAGRGCDHPRDTIRLKNLVSSVMDDETQQKIDVVKQRLIKQFAYNETSATDVLNYVASIFARGDTKSKYALPIAHAVLNRVTPRFGTCRRLRRHQCMFDQPRSCGFTSSCVSRLLRTCRTPSRLNCPHARWGLVVFGVTRCRSSFVAWC